MNNDFRPEDRRFTFLGEFGTEERLSRSMLYGLKRKDPTFPKPRLGKKYWRPDLLYYCLGGEKS